MEFTRQCLYNFDTISWLHTEIPPNASTLKNFFYKFSKQFLFSVTFNGCKICNMEGVVK